MLYTVGGGLIAVVNTDMLQFVVVVISALVAAPIAVYSAGGFSNMQSILPPEFFTFNQVDIATICFMVSFQLFCICNKPALYSKAFGIKRQEHSKVFVYIYRCLLYFLWITYSYYWCVHCCFDTWFKRRKYGLCYAY